MARFQAWLRCKLLRHTTKDKGNEKICLDCGARWPRESKAETIRKIKELKDGNKN